MEVNNVSEATPDMQARLDASNERQALRYLPVFVFLAVIMVVGTIGNILVLYVYCKRFVRTSSNYFIVAMALFDLIACVIGLPTELYDLRYSYTFTSSAMCKIFRYTESVTVYGSAIILIEIAIDRYFKICRPLMIIELVKIKAMCISAGVIAVLISVPALVLFGIARTPTHDPQIYGHDCSIEEQYRKQAFSRVYYYLLGIVFVLLLVLLSSIYIRIWIEIRKRKHIVIGDQIASSPKEDVPMVFTPASPPTSPPPKPPRVRFFSDLSDEDPSETRTSSFTKHLRPRLESIAEVVHRIRVSRTTVILFAVTVAFVVSYLPGIVIMICRSVIKDLEEKQTLAEAILSKLFSKFYFLNNAINPVIYSFLNLNFRRKCIKLLQKFLLCRKMKEIRRSQPIDRTESRSNRSSKVTKQEVV